MLEFNYSFEIPSRGIFQAKGCFEKGTKIVLLGPSGCGKTSFLKSLVNLSPKLSGKVRWKNQEINRRLLNEGILGFCFQSSPLFSHLSVLENLMLPLETLKNFQSYSKDLKKERVMTLLKKAELSHLSNRLPFELSGGEKKRISLLRSLIFSPACLILDEPFADLDEKNRSLFKKWLCEILADHDGILIYVTHHESDIENLANLRFNWPNNEKNELDFSKAIKL